MDGRTGTVTRLASRSGDGGVTRRGVMLAVLTALLAGCGVTPPSASYSFRLTVEVNTPHGVKRGSGVMQAFASKIIVLDPADPRGSGGLKGEAVVIDLAGGPVFALLKLPGARGTLDQAVTLALSPRAARGDFDSYLAEVHSLGGWFGWAKAELPRDKWPLFVRFRDLRDPKSVEAVDPPAIGVRRIIVETTSDAVTTGIEKRLGWLTAHRGSLVPRQGDLFSPNPPIGVKITEMDFSSEIAK